ncbi:hypothetical protein MANES_18G143701v8 [Manihot esculenta]|uniref:Uncharacterized protein n=1 Tax=Manihot esculenta TaxID=3983 RepID=A0ACB7G1I3_MANES|nr:hypothetical protein MANES_18G143701v8 [Manihot esculenta]
MHAKQTKEGWTGHLRRPNAPTDPKVRHFRRQVRRPKVSSRDESQALSAAESPFQSRKSIFGGKVWRPKIASTGRFGSRNHLRRPNLDSPARQNPFPPHAIRLQNLSPSHPTLPKYAQLI